MQGNIKGKEKSAIRYKVMAKVIQRLERRKRPSAPPVPSFKVKFKRGPFIAILRYSEWYILEASFHEDVLPEAAVSIAEPQLEGGLDMLQKKSV